MTADELIAEYGTSYYHKRDFVPAERILTPAEKKRAEAEYKADPLKCLMENVEQARVDARETAARLRLAKQDGILDRDAFNAAGKEQRKRWRHCITILKGDHSRALSELDHWRGGIFLWLCGKHEKARAKKWAVLERRTPPSPVECDDCRAERGLTR